MVTSYGGETSGGMSCSCLDTNTTIKCISCEDTNCHNILGVVCQAWEHLQPVNISSEHTEQPPIEPASTTAPAITDSTITGTELVTSTQPTCTPPGNNTVTLFGAIIGVLFALLLATLVGWMCTCIIMHRNNTTKSTR